MMVINLPSSSIISSMLALGDDGGVSSLAIFICQGTFFYNIEFKGISQVFSRFFLAPRFDFCFDWNSIARLLQLLSPNYFRKPSLFSGKTSNSSLFLNNFLHIWQLYLLLPRSKKSGKFQLRLNRGCVITSSNVSL